MEYKEVAHRKVACDGDGINGSHPKVYLGIKPGNENKCPYCSKKFEEEESDA